MKFKYFLKYFSFRSIYHAMPVYNFNWTKSKGFFQSLLGDTLITVVDVGARSGSAEELEPLASNICFIGFDADSDEVQRLNTQLSTYAKSKYVASFVGQKKGRVSFDLHKEAGNSSIYQFSSEYTKWFRRDKSDPVKQTFLINTDSLDNLIDHDVDFIKLDTQGTEFEIICGAPRCVGSALMVESELEFIEMYKGQKLAHDVIGMMSDQGFELLYLNRVFMNSAQYGGSSRGQLIFGDALFGVSRKRALELSVEKKMKYCALLINYGLNDFAFDLYDESPDLQQYCPKIGEYLKKKGKPPLFIKRALITIFDKLIFALMTARKTNGLGYDSDRSWPIR